MQCTNIDTELEPLRHDLVDQTVFDSLRRRINQREFDAILMSPPCSTFSAARTGSEFGSGPKALRGEYAPDIYGLKTNTIEEKKAVTVGTVLALRCNIVSQDGTRMGIPHLTETPGIRPGAPSVAKLAEIMAQREERRINR